MGGDLLRLPMFAARLRAAIAMKEWTAKDLSLAAGIHNNTVLGYLHGANEPTVSKLVNLCVTLETTPDFLLGFTDDPEPRRKRR